MTPGQHSADLSHLAEQLGISVLSDDMPRIIAAINNAYYTGVREGWAAGQREVAAEREACAQHLQACNTAITDKLAAELRARGQAPRCCEGGPQWGHSWGCPEVQG